MKKIHPSTTLAVVFNIGSIICLALGYTLPASILSLLAYFASIKEVSKYTSWYQFITVFVSALLIGTSLDLPYNHFPFLTIALLIAGFGSILRIVFFTTFSYTGYSWFEPLMVVLGSCVYILGNIFVSYGWQGYAFPLPILLFGALLGWGIIKDKKQLKIHSGGYRVQIGKPANEFALPDQNGELVKLSDFKDKRHLLLIFVRGDWCPGCHMMLRTYEKNNAKFQEKNILVMAIGPDPVGVNRGMVEKLGLDFKVLADEGQRTAMVYGVQLKEYDNDFAEKYEEGIPLPASFLIDKTGVVRYVSRPDKVGEFLNPSLIFPIIEELDGKYKTSKDILKENEALKDTSFKKTSTSEESKNQEETIDSLKKQLSNYESIIDQANDAMMVIDIVDGKIHQSNPSAGKLLEYNKEELEKLSLFDLHPKEFLEKSSSIVADVWEKGGLIYKDIPFKTKSGNLIPVECSAKVAPFAGRPAIVIYARDITERLRLEKEINEQRKEIDEKNKDISDSIEYSKRIQQSIFIEKDKLKQYAPDSFIFFKPRDVVSGDFYWFTNYDIKEDLHSTDGYHYKAGTNILVIAAVDCTGHGVPGAFMSIIGNTLLNQTLNNLAVDSAGKALDYVNWELKKSLNKNNNETPLRDGMDMALCCIDIKGMRLEYAGANNPVYIVRNKELIEFKADKQPITASMDSVAKPFTNKLFDLQKGDIIYLFTDGYADQFGGSNIENGGKKFLYKRFKETLIDMHDQTMEEQKTTLYNTFEKWRGSLSQVDDVLVIGIKI
ncbi:MAG: redoxin domain-containing protein [Bacteroidetes bacterium]|nr:redoxin domain-containing protein [Bacteroidota bacterium]